MQQLLQLCREPAPSIPVSGDEGKRPLTPPPAHSDNHSILLTNPNPNIISHPSDSPAADSESDDDQTEKLPLSVLLSAVTAAPPPSLASPHPQVQLQSQPQPQPHPDSKHLANLEFTLPKSSSTQQKLMDSASILPESIASIGRSTSLTSNRPDLGTDRGKRKRVSFAGGDLPKPITGHVTAHPRHQPADSSQISESDRRDKVAKVAHSTFTEPGMGPILGDPNRRIVLNGRGYIRLGLLGKGGSSSVYRILSQQDGQVYALKQVDCGSLCNGRRPDPSMEEDDGEEDPQDDDESDELFHNYSNEIKLLQSLSGCPHIIELIDHHLSRSSRKVSMVNPTDCNAI